MIRGKCFVTGDAASGQRLDVAVLEAFPGSSRTQCREAIGSGRILVNGRQSAKGRKLSAGDLVEVVALKERSDTRVRPDPAVVPRLVFEDEHLIAVNKPAGIAVHPLHGEERGTLMNGLVARYPELADVGDQPLMAGVLHRIDTNTSGLVLAARTEEAFASMRGQFARQEVEKRYLALVEGHVAVPGRLEHELAHDPALTSCRMADARRLAEGVRRMRAVTAYRPLELVGPYTLLEVVIRTGVTHQIRCQLALGGWPVVNDTRYGARPVAEYRRHMLHALEACFAHPASAMPCRLRAPLAVDFQAFMRAAGRVS